ncbi:MAG: lysophospholipid acyltransferase family protein [Thermoanaerobaculia bacterium]|jgi:1-acyl-sn-glycerol-3-phosphate acyltransferase|nr:lysophospholipid acyltransferase family protein [Thermoanaerobaculia bacterium]
MPYLLRRCVYTLHFVAASIVGGVLFFGVSAAALAIALVRGPEGHAAVFAARSYSRAMQRVLGWRIEAEGTERFAECAPSVVMARHQSNLDVIVYGEIFPRGAIAIGKKQLEWIPFFGRLWTATGNVLIDRRHTAAAMEAIRQAAEVAKSAGVSVWVAPEGHRNMSRELLPFKKGVFHLALGARFPILPLAVSPLDTVLDARRWAVRPGTIRLRVLPPIPVDDLAPGDVATLMSRVRVPFEEAQRELAASTPPPILARGATRGHEALCP